ncbi:hypothetical protein [Komagataeibacter melaceti]|uniref:hypothetical protein n=1 Tax=Komagataeibacter melaceti TaxID=2766577 RepID=UPI00131431FF|nr:hypothetical protein [Komagataeibacter melaceti]
MHTTRACGAPVFRSRTIRSRWRFDQHYRARAPVVRAHGLQRRVRHGVGCAP